MYWTLKRILSVGGIIIVIGIIIMYAYIQSRGIITGPEIILESPLSRFSTTTLIDVRGYAKDAKGTTLQGRPIFIDTTGRFDEKLLLSEGYNIIVLTATDAQGRVKKKTWETVYHNPNSSVPTSSTSSPQIATSTLDVIQ